ncbi:MAG: hypothetical protein ACI4KL_06005 [Lentihominibacter sp.]
MIRNLNTKLRKIVIVLTAVFVLIEITGKKEESERESRGFQTAEFDDIW